MKLNTDSSCGFKIRTIVECGILQVKTAVKKKKLLQNNPVDRYSSHYKPWCPFPVCTSGKGSLFKSRAWGGGGRRKRGGKKRKKKNNQKKPRKRKKLSQWPLSKKSLNTPAGPQHPPRILFVRSSPLKTGADRPLARHGPATRGQELRRGEGAASAKPAACAPACVCIILYVTHSGETFPTTKLQVFQR